MYPKYKASSYPLGASDLPDTMVLEVSVLRVDCVEFMVGSNRRMVIQTLRSVLFVARLILSTAKISMSLTHRFLICY